MRRAAPLLAALAVALTALLPQAPRAQDNTGQDSAPAPQEELVLGLSQTRVSITTNFDGSEILIFGAVKRDAPQQAVDADVIVTVAGPNEPISVQRKERRAGIWVNADHVIIRQAPSFYAVATSAPLDGILSATEDLRHRISIPRAIRSITSPDNVTDEDSFVEALVRIRQKAGLYQMRDGTVDFDQQTLFRTKVPLPSSLPVGNYKVEVYLLRDGAVAASHETTIRVGKVGLEQWLYGLSREHGVAYALLAIFIAVAAGWGASEIFRLIRNQ